MLKAMAVVGCALALATADGQHRAGDSGGIAGKGRRAACAAMAATWHAMQDGAPMARWSGCSDAELGA